MYKTTPNDLIGHLFDDSGVFYIDPDYEEPADNDRIIFWNSSDEHTTGMEWSALKTLLGGGSLTESTFVTFVEGLPAFPADTFNSSTDTIPVIDTDANKAYEVPAEDFLEHILNTFGSNSVPAATARIPYMTYGTDGSDGTLLTASPAGLTERAFKAATAFSSSTTTEYRYQFTFADYTGELLSA